MLPLPLPLLQPDLAAVLAATGGPLLAWRSVWLAAALPLGITLLALSAGIPPARVLPNTAAAAAAVACADEPLLMGPPALREDPETAPPPPPAAAAAGEGSPDPKVVPWLLGALLSPAVSARLQVVSA
jgi:hypothetical protein